MKSIGLGLLLVALIATIGSIIWSMIAEAGEMPWIVWVIGGALFLGSILLLAAAIRDRLKAKKGENFKGVDN